MPFRLIILLSCLISLSSSANVCSLNLHRQELNDTSSAAGTIEKVFQSSRGYQIVQTRKAAKSVYDANLYGQVVARDASGKINRIHAWVTSASDETHALFSDNGRFALITIEGNHFIYNSDTKKTTLVVLDARATFGIDHTAFPTVFSNNSSSIYFTGPDGIRIVETLTGKTIRFESFENTAHIAFNDARTQALISFQNQIPALFDLNSMTRLSSIGPIASESNHLILIDETHAISTDAEPSKQLVLWRANTRRSKVIFTTPPGQEIADLQLQGKTAVFKTITLDQKTVTESLYTIDLSQDLSFGRNSNRIRKIDLWPVYKHYLSQPELPYVYAKRLHRVQLSKDGKRVLVVGSSPVEGDVNISVYDTATGKPFISTVYSDSETLPVSDAYFSQNDDQGFYIRSRKAPYEVHFLSFEAKNVSSETVK